MTTKYYRVTQDTFLWKQGAIISKVDGSNGYKAIEDIWDACPAIAGEYISTRIIEHSDSALFFERVYPDTVTGNLFKTADQLKALYTDTFK